MSRRVACPGAIYRDAGRYWIRPRLVPGEPTTTAQNPQQPFGWSVGLSHDFEISLPDSGIRWATVVGDWRDDAELLDVRQVSDSLDFFDFFTRRQPLSGLNIEAPGEPPVITDEVEDALHQLRETGDLVSSKVLRARGGQLLVCAAVRPAVVQERLQGLVGDALYVRASPWSRDEFQRCAEQLAAERERFRFIIQGTKVGLTGQSVHVAVPVLLTADLLRWAKQWTPGLVQLRPWLRDV